MRLILLALSHEQADLELREKLSFSEAESESFLRFLKRRDLIDEALILSTCNRTELIIRYHEDLSDQFENLEEEVISMMLEWKDLPAKYSRYFRFYRDANATNHLMRVAAGLESMIPGEAQILAQLRDAYKMACNVRSNGLVINRLMHQVFKAGKRVRSETEFGMGSVSVSHAAVDLLAERLGELQGRKGLIIGAGEMARLATIHLAEKNCTDICILNRTEMRSQDLAAEFSVTWGGLDQLGKQLKEVDFVISAVRPEDYVVSCKMLENLSLQDKDLLFIDLSVPRSIDPCIRGLNKIQLLDMDALKGHVDSNLARRREEIPEVERIVELEKNNFIEWFRSLEVAPVIRQLLEHFDSIRQDEINRIRHHLSEKEFEKVSQMSGRLIKKVLHEPISRLRASSCNGNDAEFWSETVRKTFGLQEDGEEVSRENGEEG